MADAERSLFDVKMRLSAEECKNAEIIRSYFGFETKASSVAFSLGLVKILIDITESGDKIMIQSEDGALRVFDLKSDQ